VVQETTTMKIQANVHAGAEYGRLAKMTTVGGVVVSR
jgi:hypothetical protein